MFDSLWLHNIHDEEFEIVTKSGVDSRQRGSYPTLELMNGQQ